MEIETPSTVRNNEYWPEVRAGWTLVGYIDECEQWIGDEDEDLSRDIHGRMTGDDFLLVPARALDAAGIENDYYYHATHSADVLGFLCVRDEDRNRAMSVLSKIGG